MQHVILCLMTFLGLILFAACPNGEKSESAAKKPEKIASLKVDGTKVLSSKMTETSGLANVGNAIWTHNDNGNESDIFQINKENGAVQRKVHLAEIKNRDWEEIFADKDFLYVGDIGNNKGDRKNLRINKFDLSVLDTPEDVVKIEPEKIKFTYPNQPGKLKNNAHDFDAEAFLVSGDMVYIFTKNWDSRECKLYTVPNQDGEWEATYVSTFDTKGLVTSATFLDNKSKVVLLGYNKGNPQRSFIWVLSDFTGNDFFNGTKKRYNLDVYAQTEAIARKGSSSVYFTSEGRKNAPAKLYELTIPLEQVSAPQ